MAGDNNSDDFDEDTEFTKPPEKTIQEILGADVDDPSLVKYKKQLLGKALVANGPDVSFPENPERVVITRMTIVVNEDDAQSLELPPSNDFVLKILEGSTYSMHIQYFVQREIVTGLRYKHRVTRLGLPVDKVTYMFGSFAPRRTLYDYVSPVEEAPSGLLHRGKYNIASIVKDDDGHVYAKWNWTLHIFKDFIQ